MAESPADGAPAAPATELSARPRTLRLARVQGAALGLAGAAAGQVRREGLLVVLGDDDGFAGQGEASPLPGYSHDSIEECARQLAAIDLDGLPGPEGRPAEEWVESALGAARLTAPAARFALETALLDWLGQRRGLGVAVLLGGPGAAQRRVPISALVADVAAARAAQARGIRAFKLKISPATFEDDLRLASALRAAFGDEVSLRFDANGRLDPTAAMAQLQRLAALAPEFVEEPVAGDALMRMHASPVPLAADESLSVPGTWPALADVCRVVVLKPTLLGGLCACLRLARDATRRGLGFTVTHTFDGPVALAAAAELAVALPARPLACGLDRHAGLAVWPAVRIPQLHDAHVSSAGRPGLGLGELSLRT